MTRAQIATLVTTKLQNTSSAAVSLCKDFIDYRYRWLWELYLFAETLGVVSQSVTASTPEVTISSNPDIFFYPTSSTTTGSKLDFVVATKFTRTGDTDGRELVNGDWANFFQLDPNVWNNVADRRTTPSNFINLPKDASGNCRIKLVPSPDTAGTLYVLGKLKHVAMGDSDSPTLRGAENVLLPMVEGDMLEYAHKRAQAQGKFAEGMQQLAIMRDMESNQQQRLVRLIPDVSDNWGAQDLNI